MVRRVDRHDPSNAAAALSHHNRHACLGNAVQQGQTPLLELARRNALFLLSMAIVHRHSVADCRTLFILDHAVKRITETLHPRIARIVALGTPTERERTHLLSVIPYQDLTPEEIILPPRQVDTRYVRPPREGQKYVPDVY